MKKTNVRKGNDSPREYGDGLRSERYILRGLKIIPAVDAALMDQGAEETARPPGERDAAELARAPRPYFDSLTAVSALRETVDSANEIVDIMLRFGGSTDTKRKTSLWVEVAECERASADLSHRIARLRRELFT